MYKYTLHIIVVLILILTGFYAFGKTQLFGLSTFMPSQGGTGTSTAPSYGQLLVGNSQSGYDLRATSTLGIVGSTYSGFGSEFYTYFHATTTDYLTEGLTNKYFTPATFGSYFYTYFSATTTSALAEGTNLYYTDARARAALSSTATGLTYTSATGVFSLTSGYLIPTTAMQTSWNNKWDLASTTIAVPYGGTGATTITGLVLGNGTAAMSAYAGTSCTNQFPRSLSASGVATCASVANTDLTNSTIGLTSSGSITVGTSPISLGGTSALNLNMANANTWTALQTFGNASTTNIGSTGSAYFATAGGNVGIGMTNPTHSLTIAGTTPSLQVGDAFSYTPSKADFVVGSNNSNSRFLFGQNNSSFGGLTWVYNATAANAYMKMIMIGTDVMTFLQNGNVGIGTTTPYAKLSVWGSGTGTGQAFQVTNNASTSLMTVLDNGNIGIGTTDPTARLRIISSGNNTDILNLNDELGNNMFNFRHSGEAALLGMYDSTHNRTVLIDADSSSYFNGGNVGIGTTTPNQLLTVSGTRPSIKLSDYSAGTNLKTWLFSSMGGNLYVGTSTDLYATSTPAALTILNNGNVGIGTMTPAAPLDVNGVIRVKGGSFTSSLPETVTDASIVMPLGKYVYFEDASSNLRKMLGFTSSGSIIDIGQTGTAVISGINLKAGSGGYIAMTPGGGEAMRILTSGNVGIGTTTPWAKLSINNYSAGASTMPLFAIASSTGTGATSTAFIVNSLGNVGIGTTAPGGLLDVRGRFSMFGSTQGYLYFDENEMNSGYSTNAEFTSYINWDSYQAGTSQFRNLNIANGKEVSIMYFQGSTGNVGIGTTSPNNLLSIYSATKSGLEFSGSTAGSWTMGYDVSNNRFAISSSTALGTTDRLVIDSSGKVGIGTTSPYAKLSVSGQGVFDRDVRADYFTATSTTVASTFPYASTTAISSTGNAYFGTTSGFVGIGSTTPKWDLSVGNGKNATTTSGAFMLFNNYCAFEDQSTTTPNFTIGRCQ